MGPDNILLTEKSQACNAIVTRSYTPIGKPKRIQFLEIERMGVVVVVVWIERYWSKCKIPLRGKESRIFIAQCSDDSSYGILCSLKLSRMDVICSCVL